jgi:flagellar biosynthesis protein FlhB
VSDKSQKTEKPTARRRREARRKGQFPKSQEVPVAASFLAVLVALRAFGPAAAEAVMENARALFSIAGSDPSASTVRNLAGTMFVAGTVPFMAVGALFVTALGLGQTGMTVSAELIKPKFSRLSPKQGIQQYKPSTATWNLMRTFLKLALLIAIIYQPVTEAVRTLAGVRQLDRGLSETWNAVWTILFRAALLSFLIAGADYTWQRFQTIRQLRMSKEDMKQEARTTEGDPLIKGQRRRRAMEVTRNRLINVINADVVVTNPTHFAVALAYSPPEPAPRVVAKGTDRQARRIRRMAARHGVPVIEHRPLARALYRKSKVGHFVPAALYEAAAVVLAEAYRRQRRRRAA